MASSTLIPAAPIPGNAGDFDPIRDSPDPVEHDPKDETIDVFHILPFIIVHLMLLAPFVVGWSWIAVGVCVALYVVRMFAITGGYHRYFSHRSYKTGRFFQFLLAVLGTSATQKGPLWWAAHHRHHHKHSDQEEDIHSPVLRTLWWAHIGWVIVPAYNETDYDKIKDFAKYPELRFLNKYHLLPPIALAIGMFWLGLLLQEHAPWLGTTAWQMLVWGYFISTVFLYHGTFAINSFTHLFGSRRYETTDHSRNNFLTAIITLGEGWHNNHHHYCSSEPQGFYWWEIDITHYILVVLSWLGLVWDLRLPPRHVLEEGQKADALARAGAFAGMPPAATG